VNTYYDDRQVLAQAYHAGATETYHSDGSVHWIVNPGWIRSGLTCQDAFNGAFLRSDFIEKANVVRNGQLIEVLGKLSDQKANLAVAYAEASKVQKMILQTATRIDTARRALKRGDIASVLQQLNISRSVRKISKNYRANSRKFQKYDAQESQVHKTWLEYKYGWKPLLMDVKGTAELFAQHVLGRPLRFSVQGKKSVPFNWAEITPYVPFGGLGTSYYTHTLTGTYTSRVKIWVEITNPHMSALQQMGLTNPALVAWELVPYSFVFDWFISVGDWLKGLSALHGLTVRRALVSNINELKYTYSQPATTVVNSGIGKTCFQGAHYFNDTQRSYGRAPLTVDPLSLYPPVNDNLNFNKLITALALLRTQRP
jgi:hypothetical protein